tara:strand:- start:1335 stop:1718 length:384 start_codon:yes stop_codon:yes gene_type:complete
VTHNLHKAVSPRKLGLSPWSRADLPAHKLAQLEAMRHHADKQINNLREQADLLVKQAKEIDERVKLAYTIAEARFTFLPIHLKEYYLYKNDKDEYTLTLISPDEWKSPYGEFVAKVRQLGDATWEKL